MCTKCPTLHSPQRNIFCIACYNPGLKIVSWAASEAVWAAGKGFCLSALFR